MVAVPDPPDITNRGVPRGFEWADDTVGSEEFHRAELEDYLQDGAWTEGFNEWAECTGLGETQIRIVDDLGLFGAFDSTGIPPTTASGATRRPFPRTGGSVTRRRRWIRAPFRRSTPRYRTAAEQYRRCSRTTSKTRHPTRTGTRGSSIETTDDKKYNIFIYLLIYLVTSSTTSKGSLAFLPVSTSGVGS